MDVLRDLNRIRARCRDLAAQGSLGLVPTMGALHAGHLSLVRRAREKNDAVVVTIFVNPLQFGAGEDFEAYPRDEQGDARLLETAGADLVAVLEAGQVYPPGFATRITQSDLTTTLEGAARPGHFDGVLTVVAKLLLLAGARRAYFGQKDFQQTLVVRRLVDDMGIPTTIVVCPTCRDGDGLALSSRNAYLDDAQRSRGLALVKGLMDIEAAFQAGETAVAALEERLQAGLREGLGVEPDYARIVDARDLSARRTARAGDVVLVAGLVGPTRLIDNHILGARLGPFRSRA